ncbi:MAG: tripartite tricarboxylate transporter substrate-binding protein, partial [Comamonas sp.]
AIADLLAGHVDLSFMTALEASGQIKAGKLRALAVTSPQRNPQLPQVPTMAEAGLPSVAISAWYGIYMPAATPKAVQLLVHDEVNQVLALPETRTRLEAIGAELRPMSQAEFAAFHTAEYQRFGDIIRKNHIKID